MNVFGPVPSRRLGRSLGVNNIPHKTCSYACKYCQLGVSKRMQVNRQEFYTPDVLYNKVKMKISKLNDDNIPDYITIVSDGEPTLDSNLGELIAKLKHLNYPVAVITNGSLIQFSDVRRALLTADLVSIKVDTLNKKTWKYLNCPIGKLSFKKVLAGIERFSEEYLGSLLTETMLIKGINDIYEEINNVVYFLIGIKPDTAFISIPTRPPAFQKIQPAGEVTLVEAFHIFNQQLNEVKFLIDKEGVEFSSTGDLLTDLISITSVHPMREEAIQVLLKTTRSNMDHLNELIKMEKIIRVNFNGDNYYMRKNKQFSHQDL